MWMDDNKSKKLFNILLRIRNRVNVFRDGIIFYWNINVF